MRTARSVIFTLTAGDSLALLPEIAHQLPDVVGRSYADVLQHFQVEGRQQSAPSLQVRDNLALINITGPISRTTDFCSELFGGTSIDQLRSQFREALNAKTIDGILLYIDSPGGTVDGVADMADEIFNARGVKAVHAYVDAMGASAAYWLASAAESITVSQTGFVGSIGVMTVYTDTSKAMENAGMRRMKMVSSKSPNKNLEPTTDEGAAQIQARLDSLMEIFISAVAKQRGVSADTVEQHFGQGDIVIAADAVSRHMANRVGTLDDAITHMRQTLQTPGAFHLEDDLPAPIAGADDDQARARLLSIREKEISL